jgi:hypothetical protein
MRAATVSKLGIVLGTRGGLGAKLRLGIYANNSSTDNYPKAPLVDAGELDVGPTSANGVRFLNAPANTNLSADTRYWAAVLGNDLNITLGGVVDTIMIFWGVSTASGVVKFWTGLGLSQLYGALPDPAPVTAGETDLLAVPPPAILIAFSSVT